MQRERGRTHLYARVHRITRIPASFALISISPAARTHTHIRLLERSISLSRQRTNAVEFRRALLCGRRPTSSLTPAVVITVPRHTGPPFLHPRGCFLARNLGASAHTDNRPISQRFQLRGNNPGCSLLSFFFLRVCVYVCVCLRAWMRRPFQGPLRGRTHVVNDSLCCTQSNRRA